jgi:hypothetical protein
MRSGDRYTNTYRTRFVAPDRWSDPLSAVPEADRFFYPIATNTLGPTGDFILTVPIELNLPERYFRLLVP